MPVPKFRVVSLSPIFAARDRVDCKLKSHMPSTPLLRPPAGRYRITRISQCEARAAKKAEADWLLNSAPRHCCRCSPLCRQRPIQRPDYRSVVHCWNRCVDVRRWRGRIHPVAGWCVTRAGPVDRGVGVAAVRRSYASVRPTHVRCGRCGAGPAGMEEHGNDQGENNLKVSTGAGRLLAGP